MVSLTQPCARSLAVCARAVLAVAPAQRALPWRLRLLVDAVLLVVWLLARCADHRFPSSSEQRELAAVEIGHAGSHRLGDVVASEDGRPDRVGASGPTSHVT